MKWKALTAVIGVFLVGLVCGALLGRTYLKSYKYSGRSTRGHMRALSKELNLSEQQKEQIGPNLKEARRELYGLRLESYEKANKIMTRLQSKIKPFLKPEQTQKLDELNKKFHDRRNRRRTKLQRKMKSLSDANPSR